MSTELEQTEKAKFVTILDGDYLNDQVPPADLTEKVRRISVTGFLNGKGEDQTDNYYCFVLDDDSLLRNAVLIHNWAWRNRAFDRIRIIVISLRDYHKSRYEPIPEDLIEHVLPEKAPVEILTHLVHSTLEKLKLLRERFSILESLTASYEDIQRLTLVGQYLSSERDLDTLIGLILLNARELVEADSGSIYLSIRERGMPRPTHIRFKKSSMTLDAHEFNLPINKNSIAGYVAYSGDPLLIENANELPENVEYSFNSEFDRTHNYYSKSMLVIPMKNHRGDVIGVIQLINRKQNYEDTLTVDDMKGNGVISFSERDKEIAMALAGQAAVAVENNQLLQDIHNLFEGFVRASVSAIEQRDPTTSGHSHRVAEFTVGIAQAVDRVNTGRLEHVKFNLEQIREIRYASLLHDFGKVGVREHVLVKAKKLYDHEMEGIRWRFRFLKKHYENEILQKKVAHLKQYGSAGFDEIEAALDSELFSRLDDLTNIFHQVEQVNEPTVSEEDINANLLEIAKIQVPMDIGDIPFLSDNELVSLSIRRGSLNEEERVAIMLHVSNTYNFLIQIPWTDNLKMLPEIAFHHHEKLDGTGYPLGLESHEIPIQAKMMTISDIYDALTARDRPYKKEVPMNIALDILKREAQEGKLDSDLLNVFIEAELFKQFQSDYNNAE